MISAYLQHLKKRDIKKASICEYCKQPSTNINSDGYRIIFVCDNHYIEKKDDINEWENEGGSSHSRQILGIGSAIEERLTYMEENGV
jgi:hypothetical protein